MNVADYRPTGIAPPKIYKEGILILRLVRTDNILLAVGPSATTQSARDYSRFAVKTENIKKSAREKLNRKALDMICANDNVFE
jgi:phosphopantothenoylcysteine synthetase/decarboxylase